MNIKTKMVHVGQHYKFYGAVNTPIVMSSTFAKDRVKENNAFEYSRGGNPTRLALELSLAQLENGKHCFCFSSGVAAIKAVTELCSYGDSILVQKRTYLGTERIFKMLENSYNINIEEIELNSISKDNLSSKVTTNTKMLWIETPSNPHLEIIDIKRISELVKAISPNILLCVDNTFASPFIQNPLNLGADIVVHSASKYLNGHSDVILGAVILNRETIAKKIKFIQNATGAIPSPMDCFLVLRGIKTLPLRMVAHSSNAKMVADFLSNRNEVKKVYYPTIQNKSLVRKQMNGYGGGMISINLKSINPAKFINNLKLFKIAESLGGVESLITHPYSTSHKHLPKSRRKKVNIEKSFIRISVGIEHVYDLIKDMERAFSKF